MIFAAENVTDSPEGWQVTGYLSLRAARARLAALPSCQSRTGT